MRRALSYMEPLGADRILILGDVLYHGPRNPIPAGYDPQGVVALLNPLADRIAAVRGNCEAEVDQMLLDFPCMGDYLLLQEPRCTIFATHGHLYSPEALPKFVHAGDVFAYGHTHLYQLEENAEGIVLFNPGSVTLPKQGRPATFGLIADDAISVRLLETGEPVLSHRLR